MYFELQRSRIGNECSYIEDTFSERKWQFSTKVCAPSRLVSVVWAKFKDVLIQKFEMSCKNKLKLTKIKDVCLNSADRLAKQR